MTENVWTVSVLSVGDCDWYLLLRVFREQDAKLLSSFNITMDTLLSIRTHFLNLLYPLHRSTFFSSFPLRACLFSFSCFPAFSPFSHPSLVYYFTCCALHASLLPFLAFLCFPFLFHQNLFLLCLFIFLLFSSYPQLLSFSFSFHLCHSSSFICRRQKASF